MAYKTAEQKDASHQLQDQYGPADRVMIEKTNEPYGIVWLRWHSASISSEFPDRNLFIKPDGTRLSWTLQ